jgi:hypothetical protein
MISRKENPRDPMSILSIREVLRHKSPRNSDITHLLSGAASHIPSAQGSSGKSGLGASQQRLIRGKRALPCTNGRTLALSRQVQHSFKTIYRILQTRLIIKQEK